MRSEASCTAPFFTLTVKAPSPSTRASTSTLIVRLLGVTFMGLTRLAEGLGARVVGAQQPHDVIVTNAEDVQLARERPHVGALHRAEAAVAAAPVRRADGAASGARDRPEA